MAKRLSISVSFTKNEKELYNHAHKQPNTAYYIKYLIKADIEKQTKVEEKKVVEEMDLDVDIKGFLDW